MNDKTIRFTALETFFSRELASMYVAGLSYTYNPVDSGQSGVLRTLIPKWLNEGKIKLGGPTVELSGRG